VNRYLPIAASRSYENGESTAKRITILNNDLMSVAQDYLNHGNATITVTASRNQELSTTHNTSEGRKAITKVTAPRTNSSSLQGRITGPKQLCYEMLGDVLKVPHRNRPNRALIRKMLVQTNQSNNVFSDNKISFRRMSMGTANSESKS
jgi:hypothetical protein